MEFLSPHSINIQQVFVLVLMSYFIRERERERDIESEREKEILRGRGRKSNFVTRNIVHFPRNEII